MVPRKPKSSYKNQVRLFYHELIYIRLLLIIQMQILVGDLHGAHLGSTKVTNKVLLITHDWKELETWAWSYRAYLVTMHRLICNMTCLDQHVTSRGLGLIVQSPCITFDALWREEHDGARIMPLAFLVEKLLATNLFAKNSYFELKRPNRWCQLKSDGMLATEEFKTYRVLSSTASYLK